MNIDLLTRKATHFVLWAPRQTNPALVIGTLQPGAPPKLAGKETFQMERVVGRSGLWEMAPAACALQDAPSITTGSR